MSWDDSYAAPSGLRCNLKTNRPPITPDCIIRLDFTFIEGHTYAELTVEPNTQSLPPKPLSAEHHNALKRFLEYLRIETARSIGTKKTQSIHEGLLYIVHAIQVRLNQHWHATEAGKEVSLDELLGVLTMKDEVKAEEQMGMLMESLSVRDDAGMEERHA